jgi:hypothetical protein
MRALRTMLSCLILASVMAGCVVYDRGPRYGYGGGYYGGGYYDNDWHPHRHYGW